MEIVKNSVIKYTYKSPQKSDKLLLLDLDGTLIKTKSGNKFPRNAADWQFIYDINKLPRDCEIIIISNQSRAANKRSVTRKKLNLKIPAILRASGINTAYILVAYDSYRKPATSLLEDYIKPQNYKSTIYVGDAAGRSGDFADSDYLLACNYNILHPNSITFMTPEQFFKNDKSRPILMRNFDPPVYFAGIRGGRSLRKIKYDIDAYKINTPECIYICGPPSCGKSMLSKRIKSEWNYKRIARRVNKKLRSDISYVVDINPVIDTDFIYNHSGGVRIFILLENRQYNDNMKTAICKSCIIANKKMSRAAYNVKKLDDLINDYYKTRSFPRGKKKWNVINIEYDVVNIKSEKHFKYLMQYY